MALRRGCNGPAASWCPSDATTERRLVSEIKMNAANSYLIIHDWILRRCR
jgi:hypothetical protein